MIKAGLAVHVLHVVLVVLGVSVLIEAGQAVQIIHVVLVVLGVHPLIVVDQFVQVVHVVQVVLSVHALVKAGHAVDVVGGYISRVIVGLITLSSSEGSQTDLGMIIIRRRDSWILGTHHDGNLDHCSSIAFQRKSDFWSQNWKLLYSILTE